MTNAHSLLNFEDDEDHLHARNMDATTQFRATTRPKTTKTAHCQRIISSVKEAFTRMRSEELLTCCFRLKNKTGIVTASLALNFTDGGSKRKIDGTQMAGWSVAIVSPEIFVRVTCGPVVCPSTSVPWSHVLQQHC